MSNPRVLFILKRREDYNTEKHSNSGMSTGLFNSSSFMNDMLNDCNIESKILVVVDNNEIDREVTKFKPTHVIIEALWVVPSKFSVLCELHPKIKWVIRLHSELPFLSNEGNALDWLGDYSPFENVIIAVNAPRILIEIREFLGIKLKWDNNMKNKKVIYLPNFYPQNYKFKFFNKNKDYIDISCFGAIRPMKNHTVQAIASIRFAEKINKKLRFHINSGRVEQKGDSSLNNLKGLFSHLYESGHRLVNHEWSPRNEFIETCYKMDIGVQVSFSETFNIVGADIVTQGVPFVGSEEIPWIFKPFSAKPTESDEIYKKLLLAYKFPLINNIVHQYLLNRYTNKTRKTWINYLKDNKI